MRVVIAALALVLASSVAASELGRVVVPVDDRSTGARETAMTDGLERVLVRLTGSRTPVQLEGVSSMLRQPSRWARQFSYSQAPATEEAGDAPALTLVVDFDTGALIEGLQAAGAPVWSAQRPEVLFWTVLQRPSYGELLSARADDPVARALVEQGQARGLPLVLPAMDSTDLAAISPADVRGRFDRVIAEASRRYQSSLRVAAVIYTGSPVQVRWRLFEEGDELSSGDFTTDTEAEAVSALVDAVTAVMVRRYAVVGGSGSVRAVRVKGISSLARWQEAARYLDALAGVSDVQMKAVDGESVFFELVFSGTEAQLGHLIQVNQRLTPCAESEPAATVATADVPAQDAASAPAVLTYCWQERP